MNTAKDSLYANPIGEIAAFKFDDSVASVFPDMIGRSVPGYSTIIAAIGLLAQRYAQTSSNCYDLGCSLGTASFAMQSKIKAANCTIIAVDNSSAMTGRLQQCLENQQSITKIEVICADIRNIDIVSASVVVLNFTLQFVPVDDRLVFLKKIHAGLLPNGILILSEKLRFTDSRQDELQSDMHHLFKKANGYSDLEISQKRTALENVLVPETLIDHQMRLAQAGFSSAEIWFQYFNFASLIALK